MQNSKVLNEAKKQARDLWKLLDYVRGASPISDFRSLAYALLFIRYMQSKTGQHFEAPRFYSFAEISHYINELVILCVELGFISLELKGYVRNNLNEILLKNNHIDEEYVRWAIRNNYDNRVSLLARSTLSELDYLFAESEGKSGSEFYTPIDVNRLVTTLGLDCTPRDICDPFAGGGNTAFSFHDALEGNVTIDTQEVNHDVHFQIIVSRIIRGIKGKDFYGNSLTKPQYLEKKYDLIASFPPFGLKIPKSTRSDITDRNENYWLYQTGELPETRSDWFITLSMLSAVKSNGRLIVGMALGAMTRSGAESRVRKQLVEDGVIEQVILLPKGIHYSTSISTALVVLRPGRNRIKHDISFVDASLFYDPRRGRNVLSPDNIGKIIESCHQDGRFSFTASYNDIVDNDFNLDPTLYVRKTIKVSQVSVRNFRGYKNFTIPMHESLTVLVGENGAGKTSILEAIACGLGPFLTAMPDAKGKLIRKSDIHVGANGMADSARISIDTASSLSWDLATKGSDKNSLPKIGTSALSEYAKQIVDKEREYPLIAYYGTSRALSPNSSKVSINPFEKVVRGEGYESALDARINYSVIKNWFSKIEVDELRLRNEKQNHKLVHTAKTLITRAVKAIVQRAENVTFDQEANDVIVTWKNEQSQVVSLSLEQLSEGYRNMVALTIDLVRRSYLLNPQSKDYLSVHGIVLIDEIELHLHPRWQQKVLKDLTSLFDNVQFVVTTHSPQVLATVKGESIRVVSNSLSEAERVNSPYGGDSSRVMQQVLSVDPRPITDVSRKLKEYFTFIEAGQGESKDALKLRKELNTLTDGTEPMLDQADLAIKRVKWMDSRRSK